MTVFTKKELATLRPLTTPRKIQDFLERLRINFEERGETCMSPRRVLQEGRAHCLEGAMLAAAALSLHGQRPLLLDLTAIPSDDDHVVALFQQHGCWGAISKTNHAVLRYREPIYKTIRELALSYFHEYFINNGKKTLRSYSTPLDLRRFDSRNWMTDEDDLWYIVDALNAARHFSILTPAQTQTLRRADAIEIKAGKLMEWHTRT